MLNEKRYTVAEVPSGKIEIVFNGVCSTLQFNCSCEDAWPLCQAMCCRLRTNFNIILRPEEIAKFNTKPMPHNPQFRILQHRSDGSCDYLEKDGVKCVVHEKGKPWACSVFHCSPGGLGEGVLYKNNGWLISPMRRYEQVDDSGEMVNWNEIYAKAEQANLAGRKP